MDAPRPPPAPRVHRGGPGTDGRAPPPVPMGAARHGLRAPGQLGDPLPVRPGWVARRAAPLRRRPMGRDRRGRRDARLPPGPDRRRPMAPQCRHGPDPQRRRRGRPSRLAHRGVGATRGTCGALRTRGAPGHGSAAVRRRPLVPRGPAFAHGAQRRHVHGRRTPAAGFGARPRLHRDHGPQHGEPPCRAGRVARPGPGHPRLRGDHLPRAHQLLRAQRPDRLAGRPPRRRCARHRRPGARPGRPRLHQPPEQLRRSLVRRLPLGLRPGGLLDLRRDGGLERRLGRRRDGQRGEHRVLDRPARCRGPPHRDHGHGQPWAAGRRRREPRLHARPRDRGERERDPRRDPPRPRVPVARTDAVLPRDRIGRGGDPAAGRPAAGGRHAAIDGRRRRPRPGGDDLVRHVGIDPRARRVRPGDRARRRRPIPGRDGLVAAGAARRFGRQWRSPRAHQPGVRRGRLGRVRRRPGATRARDPWS